MCHFKYNKLKYLIYKIIYTLPNKFSSYKFKIKNTQIKIFNFKVY